MKGLFKSISIIGISLCILSGCSSVTSVFKNEPDFRNAKWGMTKEQVIKSETPDATKVDYFYILTEKSYPGTNALYYTTRLVGKEVNLVYSFDKEKLIGAKYYYDNVYNSGINGQRVQEFCDAIEPELINKYGTPEIKEGPVVMGKKLSRELNWTSGNTYITLYENPGLENAWIVYHDKKYSDASAKEEDKPVNKKL